MKKTAFAACASVLLFTVCAVSQDQDQNRAQQQQRETRSEQHVKSKNLKGWVRKDGDNYVFENDADKQRWSIKNSEAVKEHEGHHVQLNARVHEDDHSLEVNKVNKRLRETKSDRDAHDQQDDRH